jgi:hypothetical protein
MKTEFDPEDQDMTPMAFENYRMCKSASKIAHSFLSFGALFKPGKLASDLGCLHAISGVRVFFSIESP